jgi:hypothetical protein
VTNQLGNTNREADWSEQERDFVRHWRELVDRAGGQSVVARRLRWSTSTVSRDYKGEQLPKDERLVQLCRFLEMSREEAASLAMLLEKARAARRAHPARKESQVAQPGQPPARRSWPRIPAWAAGVAVTAVVALAVMAWIWPTGSASPTAGAPPSAAAPQPGPKPTGGPCLGAMTTGRRAGQNRDPVRVWDCSLTASEIWIPEQWEVRGARFSWLVNDEYQSKCLNADNIGGLAPDRIVQLWNCYSSNNEEWDFGDWYSGLRSGASSYPIFVKFSDLCLDADKFDLRDGTTVHIWNQYPTASQFWS